MKPVRLLPVVIFAALALLVFKGVGLVTNGGYVLTGTTEVFAAGGGGHDAAPSTDSAATADLSGGLPQEVVIADISPTIGEDGAPTLKTAATASHGSESTASSDGGHGAPAESSSDAAHSDTSSEAAATPAPCPLVADTAATGSEHGATTSTEHATGCVSQEIPVNEHGDALPLVRDAQGKLVPLESTGDTSEDALVARLGERRAELDQREADLGMRTALLDAAEKRLDERAKQLAALEAQVSQLVDEKQAAEDAGFKSVVSMYETMKPKDAAKIFDTLTLSVLVKVVRAMNPRKMAPILAAMSAEPAQQLTVALAATESTEVVVPTGENLTALPQIVGQ